jgi:hypothetical protein
MYLKNFIFIGMIITYGYAIYSVYNYYKESDHSISSIIKERECNQKVFNGMFIMGFLTIIYELLRYDIISFISILLLLLGIYGVIIYDHTIFIHYIFCFIVFISILCFMYKHCYYKKNIFLFLLLYLQEVLCALIFLESNILNMEIYLLANFALFYLYLHFL